MDADQPENMIPVSAVVGGGVVSSSSHNPYPGVALPTYSQAAYQVPGDQREADAPALRDDSDLMMGQNRLNEAILTRRGGMNLSTTQM